MLIVLIVYVILSPDNYDYGGEEYKKVVFFLPVIVST